MHIPIRKGLNYIMSKKKNNSSEITENTASESVSEESKAADNKAEEKPAVISAEEQEKAEKKRIRRRKMKYGGAATAVTVVVIAVVVLVNVVLGVLSDRINMSVDITPNGTFEISQETIDYLATVNEPVEIVCMSDELEFSTSNYVYFKQAYEVLKKYTIYSDNISLKFVDMTKDPTYANKYSELYKGNISEYSIVVSTDKRIKVISIQDLYNVEMDYNTYSQKITSSKAEQELTSAIMYVTDPSPLNAVMFNSETGGSCYDNVYDMLVSNGYNVSEINPLVDEIPEDTDIIAICAPTNDYDEETVQKIYDFLDNGGQLGKNLIYVADYTQNSTTNIDSLLAEWGIKIGDGVVGDSNTSNTASSSQFVIGNYINTEEDNYYDDNVSDTSLPVLSYYSRPIELLFDQKDNRLTYPLVTTDDTAFVYTEDMQSEVENGTFDPETGSYTTMAVARKYVFNSDNEAVYSSVLAVGSSYMLDSSITGATYYNNGDYFISALNTLTGKTSGISIVAKDLTSTTFDMDQATYNTCFIVFVILIPLAVLVIGIVVYVRRRHK